MLRNTRVMTQEQCDRKQQQQRQQQEQEEAGGKKRKKALKALKALKPPPTPADFGRIFLALQLVDCCAMEGTVSPEQLRVRMMRTLSHKFSQFSVSLTCTHTTGAAVLVCIYVFFACVVDCLRSSGACSHPSSMPRHACLNPLTAPSLPAVRVPCPTPCSPPPSPPPTPPPPPSHTRTDAIGDSRKVPRPPFYIGLGDRPGTEIPSQTVLCCCRQCIWWWWCVCVCVCLCARV